MGFNWLKTKIENIYDSAGWSILLSESKCIRMRHPDGDEKILKVEWYEKESKELSEILNTDCLFVREFYEKEPLHEYGCDQYMAYINVKEKRYCIRGVFLDKLNVRVSVVDENAYLFPCRDIDKDKEVKEKREIIFSYFKKIAEKEVRYRLRYLFN